MSSTREEEIGDVEPDGEFTFQGYRRDGFGVGARNHLLVLPSVICSHVVADRIAKQVTGAKSAAHDHGCAQLGRDNDQTERTFVGVATNPNVAGTLVVGLGCEHVRSHEVKARLEELGARVRELTIQGVGGTDATIEQGVDTARDMLKAASADRTVADASDLTVGIVSSDLGEGTISTADPLVGDFVDRIVGAGGRVVATGVERLLAHPDDARSLATDDALAGLENLLERHAGIPARETRIRRTAGELDLSTATRAWGDNQIVDVLEYGERARHDSGLAVVDAPSQFGEAATGLAAAGAQVVVHVTDEGIPTGHPVAPVIKVTGNEETYEALATDIDLNANAASAGDLQDYVESVLDGQSTLAEEHGLEDFAITRIGPST
ncbi:MAG: UxaA family hydrolase [Halodesulfurarchaeum sp.]